MGTRLKVVGAVLLSSLGSWLRGGLFAVEPRFSAVFWPSLCVSVLLFMRSPASNYIFDEQEALLGNPYLNTPGIPFWDVFERDFWGLPPDGTIGSYRPLPNIAWRVLWSIAEQPWLLHWLNLILHAVNASLLTSFVGVVTGDRRLAWLVGAAFIACAMLTEAVTGVVGLADVLAGTGVLLALHSLRLHAWLLVPAVFVFTLLGLGAKESALVLVPLIGWAALVLAPALRPLRPLRWVRAILAAVGSGAAFVGYTYFRRAMFPSPVSALPSEPLLGHAHWVESALRAFLVWFRQPELPHDPLNNPLLDADLAHRLAGALSVYARSLLQLVFPWRLSGDYSFAEERVPDSVLSGWSISGAVLMVGPPIVALCVWSVLMLREQRLRRLGEWPRASGGLRAAMLSAVALLWFPVAYFPHSNIPVLLPTVRAERLWYLPAMGTSVLMGYVLLRLLQIGSGAKHRAAVWVAAAFLAFQALQARIHALAYTSDLAFWRANLVSAPRSAKAHLNYAVMLGARGRQQERLLFNHRALQLAPDWPMGNVYYADALCRHGRPERAFRYYERGFVLGPNQKSLIALGLQCLWDTGKIPEHASTLRALAVQHPGSWLAYLALDIVEHGEEYGGVRPEHRPRGYDQKRVEDGSEPGSEEGGDASSREESYSGSEEGEDASPEGGGQPGSEDGGDASPEEESHLGSEEGGDTSSRAGRFEDAEPWPAIESPSLHDASAGTLGRRGELSPDVGSVGSKQPTQPK